MSLPQIFQISQYLHKQCLEIGANTYHKHNLDATIGVISGFPQISALIVNRFQFGLSWRNLEHYKIWRSLHITFNHLKRLKSLGPIDRKFYGHGKNDGFVLFEFIIKQCSSFCKYTNISVMKKNIKEITCQQ